MHPLKLSTVCVSSEDVVAREIESEIVIVPLTAGIGNMEDELYTFNPTGRAIWKKLDGQRTLKDVAELLGKEFDPPLSEIERDVLGFASELLRRRILVVKSES